MLFFLLISYSVFGQVTVSGKVVDENEGVLPSATIIIKGTQKGTMTDFDGNFEIQAENENDILVFRFVGFETREIIVSEAPEIINLGSTLDLGCPVVGISVTQPLRINYWSGLKYNPYGIEISKGWHSIPSLPYFSVNIGYSTNFKDNSDFFGAIGIDLFKRTIFYRFQQTTFKNPMIENRIITHTLDSRSKIKFITLFYGVGHQQFRKRDNRDNLQENYGVYLGLWKFVNVAKFRHFCQIILLARLLGVGSKSK